MKKHYYFAGLATAALLSIASIAGAQTLSETNIVVDVGTETNTDQAPTLRTQADLREKLRLQEDARKKQMEMVQREQNILRDRLKLASSTLQERRDIIMDRNEAIKDIRADGRVMLRTASGTMERKEIRRDMRRDIFKERLSHIVRQLNVSLENLKQVRARIVSRIEKAELSGRTMAEARTSLVIADAKIVAAEQAIAALVAYNPPTSPTASSSIEGNDASTSVDLEGPRNLVENAKKAVKEAHRSLRDVVVAIAHNMGLKLRTEADVQATSTVQ